MRIAIVYPPFQKNGKFPLLGQNRQFRYSSSKAIRIYPIVPATAATLLKKNGFDVLFLDAINQRLSMESFLDKLHSFNPDILVMETKTPIIQRHWKFIDEIKKSLEAKCVLVGDHVTANPLESLENSNVDYVISGGDYDITLLNLCLNIDNKNRLPRRVWFRENGSIEHTNKMENIEDLNELPFIDRKLTKWELYGEAYLYDPCTYIMSGRGCGIASNEAGSCAFCSWQHNLWECSARLRSPSNVAEEVQILSDEYKVKEVFDDNESGAIWNKKWLKKFHLEMKERGLIGKVRISSNSRADKLDKEACTLLKKTGFRLLKVGLESGNDETLQKLNKKEKILQIIKGVKNAKDSGLNVMLTIMMGYPWENEKDAHKTYKIVRDLMLYKTRFGDSLQASTIIPYPGTPMHRRALNNKWFIIDPFDYEKYDMSRPVLRSQINPLEWCDKLWSIHVEPNFMIKSAITMRSGDDLRLAFKGYKSIVAHKIDF